ncbi:MAG: hypothetical protein HY735_09420 [Verrucomicrobia bacterium]|nr:hypothetical protein [Verrucomicrobiota bacterium]
MLGPADKRRRWFGTLFLLIAGGLLVWGQTILKPHLGKGLGFVLYWLLCFFFTGLAIATALLDLWIVRRRAQLEEEELLRQSAPESRARKLPSSELMEPRKNRTTRKPKRHC